MIIHATYSTNQVVLDAKGTTWRFEETSTGYGGPYVTHRNGRKIKHEKLKANSSFWPAYEAFIAERSRVEQLERIICQAHVRRAAYQAFGRYYVNGVLRRPDLPGFPDDLEETG